MTQKHFFTLTLTTIGALLFLLLPANAGVHATYNDGERIILQEIAIPKAAGDYYRNPGKYIASEGESRWFGPEIDSRVLCPMMAHPFNDAGFFDIIYTREEAEVWPSSRPGKVWWYRKQEWRFATADTPWGTDTVRLILASEIGWTDIDSGNSTTGFPWSGFEEHWRDGDFVKSKSEIIGYYPYEHAGKKYLAPKYYKNGTLDYTCATGTGRHNLKVLSHTEEHFTDPTFRPKSNQLSRREKGADNWYDCLPLK
ncbi:hypothetical protein F4X10_02395 [Candidatus Poribacteria bacterium]|nr:hypothetical protein [Candidatus Poribacteria bacterium]